MFDKYSYCMKLVKQVERKYSVQQWMIDGVQIWPILRISSKYKENDESLDVVNIKSGGENFFRTLYKKFFSLIDIIKRYKFLTQMELKDQAHNDYIDGHRDIVVLSYSCYRKGKINEDYYFTEIFPFLNKFNGYSYLILESAINDVWKYPRYGKSVLVDKDKYVVKIMNKFKKFLLFWHDDTLQINCYQQLQEIYQYLEKRKVGLLSIKRLISYVHEINDLKPYYLNILKKATPKIVIIEWYSSVDGFALILAAKQLGIPVADIQHGIQGSNHWAYGDWPANPDGYQLLPDYFFVWSSVEKEIVQRWNKLCGSKHRPIITGYQWISMWKTNDLPVEFKKQINQLKQLISKECNENILFSMDYELPNENIIKIIQNSPKNWQWWIRMHPVMRHRWGEFASKFEEIFSTANVIWEEASDCALPALLSFVDLHITSGSTVARICQEWGIPSIAENPKVQEGYDLNQCLITIIPFEKLTIQSIKGVLQQQSSAKKNEEKEQDELKFIKDEILDKM